MHTFRNIDTIQPLRAWETALHELMTLFVLAVVITLCACTLWGTLCGLFRMWRYIWLAFYKQKQHK